VLQKYLSRGTLLRFAARAHGAVRHDDLIFAVLDAAQAQAQSEHAARSSLFEPTPVQDDHQLASHHDHHRRRRHHHHKRREPALMAETQLLLLELVHDAVAVAREQDPSAEDPLFALGIDA
jgi:hypothetical protein